MKMSILRAVRELEMDVDLDVQTEIQNIERDSPNYVTLYGTEDGGKLYYIVLDQKTIEYLKTI